MTQNSKHNHDEHKHDQNKHEHDEHEHDEHEHDGHEHDGHSHGGKTAVILFFVGLCAYLLGMFVKNELLNTLLNVFALITSGYHIIIEGLFDTYKESLKKKKFVPNIHLLMTLAAVGAIIIGEKQRC